jgi:anti-anti-sigma factor
LIGVPGVVQKVRGSQGEMAGEFVEISSQCNPRRGVCEYVVTMTSDNSRDDAFTRMRSTENKTDKGLTLTLEAGNSGGAMVLHCRGRLFYHREARELSNIVTEVLPSAQRMVVDLGGVDSVDSGALGELVMTHMWAEAAGYRLMFASPKKAVQHLFEATNLLSIFDVYVSVPEAMAAMVEGGARSG